MPEDAQETQLLDTEQQTSSATKKKKPSLATEQRYTQQLATWGESRATSNIVSPAHLAHCKMLRAAMMVFLASTNKASCSPISAPPRLLRVDDTVWRRPTFELQTRQSIYHLPLLEGSAFLACTPIWDCFRKLRHMLLAPSFICPLACNSQVELFPASSQGASSTALPAAASGCAAKHFFAAKFVKEPLPVRLQTSRPSSSAIAAVHSSNKAPAGPIPTRHISRGEETPLTSMKLEGACIFSAAAKAKATTTNRTANMIPSTSTTTRPTQTL